MLENMATNFFKELYDDEGHYVPFILSGCFLQLNDDEVDLLERPTTEQEVKKALFDMGGFKAPGCDGLDRLHAIFYQSQWKVVGQDLFSLVMEVFRKPEEVKSLNKTLITLIPKVEPAVNLKHF